MSTFSSYGNDRYHVSYNKAGSYMGNLYRFFYNAVSPKSVWLQCVNFFRLCSHVRHTIPPTHQGFSLISLFGKYLYLFLLQCCLSCVLNMFKILCKLTPVNHNIGWLRTLLLLPNAYVLILRMHSFFS